MRVSLLLLLALAQAVASGAAQQNDELVLSFNETTLRASVVQKDSGYALVFDELSWAGVSLDLSASPLWSVDLRPALQDEEGFVPALRNSGDDLRYRVDGGASLVLDRSHLAMEKRSEREAVFTWSSVPDPYGGSLEVELDVELEDGGFLADLNVSREGGDQAAIISGIWPVLRLGALGENSDDDVLVYPLVGDAMFLNPLGNGVCLEDSERSYPRGWALAYPGEVQLQMMAFYSRDDDAGLLMVAMDPLGRLKKLMALVQDGVEERFLELYVRAYQEVNAASKEEAFAAMQSFHSPYPVLVRLFRGDWVDAAELYRSLMLERIRPGFVEAGPLWKRMLRQPRRGELGPGISKLATGQHSCRYAPSLDQAASVGINYLVPPDEVSYEDPAVFLRLLDTVRFFADWGVKSVVILPCVIEDPPCSECFGRDFAPSTLREGLASFVERLHREDAVVAVIFNRDGGGWPLEEGTPAYQAALEHGMEAIAYEADGIWFAKKEDEPYTKSCSGSQWVSEHRSSNLADVLEQAEELGGPFSGVFLSGSWAYANACYAPVLFGLDNHRHTTPGGSYHVEEIMRVSRQLMSTFAAESPRPFLLLSERGHEWLIGSFASFLAARSYPFFSVSLGHGGTFTRGWIPVPLTLYVWHDWHVSSSEGVPLSNMVEQAGWDAEEPEVYPGALYKAAYEAVVLGEVMGLTVVSADVERATGTVYKELDGAYGCLPPSFTLGVDIQDLLPAARKFREFLRILAQLRWAARDWLVLGRMLRRGSVDVPEVSFPASLVNGGFQQVSVPAVLHSAWRAPSGEVSLIAVNVSDQAQSFSWSFSSEELGLERGQWYAVVRRRLRGPVTSEMPAPEEITRFVAVGDEIVLSGLEAARYDDKDSVVWLELVPLASKRGPVF